MCNKTNLIDFTTLTVSYDKKNKFFLCEIQVLMLCHSTSVSPACGTLFRFLFQCLQT